MAALSAGFQRDRSTGLQPAEAVELYAALQRPSALLVPAAGENIFRFSDLPAQLNNLPVELMALLQDPAFMTSQEIFGVSDGTSDAETFTLEEGTADTKITTDGQPLVDGDDQNRLFGAIVLAVDPASQDVGAVLRATITGTSPYGAVSIVTELRAALSKESQYAVILLHRKLNGLDKWAPCYAGRRSTQAQGADAAQATVSTNVALTVALTGCANKSIKCSFLNASHSEVHSIISGLAKLSDDAAGAGSSA